MKKFLISVIITFISIFAQSQTYPLIAENNALKVESIGWVGTNSYRIKVTNKANCSTSIRINYNTGTKDTTLSNLVSTYFNLNNVLQSATYIRVKRTSGATCISSCSEDYVYVGFNNVILPVQFKSIISKRIDDDHVMIIFEAEEDNTIQNYRIKISSDGIDFKDATIIFPNGIQGNKKYTITLTLSKL